MFSCNPAKWIIDMVWLNLVEHSKFHPFSKVGEGDTDMSAACHYQNKDCIQTAIKVAQNVNKPGIQTD